MLKSVVKKILKTANLEEVTMKTVCKQVCWLTSSVILQLAGSSKTFECNSLENLFTVVFDKKWNPIVKLIHFTENFCDVTGDTHVCTASLLYQLYCFLICCLCSVQLLFEFLDELCLANIKRIYSASIKLCCCCLTYPLYHFMWKHLNHVEDF